MCLLRFEKELKALSRDSEGVGGIGNGVRVRRLDRLTQRNESAILSCLSLLPQKTLVGLGLTHTSREGTKR